MDKQRELKPCPFCGGRAEIIVIEKGVKSIVVCTTHYCGVMRHSFNNGETDERVAMRLTTAWNRRADIEDMAKVLKGMDRFDEARFGFYESYARAIYNAGYRKQSDLSPCDVCQFNPPSSFDGKPCAICPAR